MIRISIGNRANSKYLSCTADFVLVQSVETGLMKRNGLRNEKFSDCFNKVSGHADIS